MLAVSTTRPQNMIIVGVPDIRISADPEVTLVTYSLGSCLGITFYDPELRLGGMLHCMLPTSTNDPVKAKGKPSMYVDTGVTALLQQLYNMGAERKRLICKVAGGAAPMDEGGFFKIGERNFAVFKKVLWKNNILIKGEDVGGNQPRTLFLDISNGRVWIKNTGQDAKEL